MKDNLAHQLDELLNEVARDYEDKKDLFYSDRLRQLEKLVQENHDHIITLKEESKSDFEKFIVRNPENHKRYLQLENEMKRVKGQLEEAVDAGDFALAAQKRDQLRKVKEFTFQTVMEMNEFDEGFNAWRDKVVFIGYSDYSRSLISGRLLTESRLKGE